MKKKFWVLFSLFILPLVFYIFLLTGTNEFAKLPVVTQQVGSLATLGTANDSITLENKISIVSFLGTDIDHSKSNALNLNEKIYKHFYGFPDFQFIIVIPKGAETPVEQLKKEIGFSTNMSKWKFVFADLTRINQFFSTFQTPYQLDEKGYTPYAFVVDKDSNLRGRLHDEDMVDGKLYGYNAEVVSTVHSKMVDDVKVLIAEYRLALKKNKREI